VLTSQSDGKNIVVVPDGGAKVGLDYGVVVTRRLVLHPRSGEGKKSSEIGTSMCKNR
jgi:hypothetical protein